MKKTAYVFSLVFLALLESVSAHGGEGRDQIAAVFVTSDHSFYQLIISLPFIGAFGE